MLKLTPSNFGENQVTLTFIYTEEIPGSYTLVKRKHRLPTELLLY